MPESVRDRPTKAHEHVFLLAKSERYYYDAGAVVEIGEKETRNVRTVWTIPMRPYSGSHFAVMPPNLVRRCIQAGCPKGGIVLDPFFGSGTTGEVAEAEGRLGFRSARALSNF